VSALDEAHSAEVAEMNRLCEILRAATEGYLESDSDAFRAMSRLMNAHIAAAGKLFGSMIVFGLARPLDVERAADMARRNFEVGVDVGKHQYGTIVSGAAQ